MAETRAENTRNQVAGAFGQQNAVAPGTVDTSTHKDTLLSFNVGNVYLGLRMVSYFDEETKTHKPGVPRITWSFNGKFIDAPANGKWWKQFAEFAQKMAVALEGCDIATAKIVDDVDHAKAVMAKFKTQD